jgi:hypothetical protein
MVVPIASSWENREVAERRFDGPILPHDPALAGRRDRGGVARLLGRLAAEARAGLALRRLGLDAKTAARDGRLGRGCRQLRNYRDQAAGLV